jgi:hypothetical protein
MVTTCLFLVGIKERQSIFVLGWVRTPVERNQTSALDGHEGETKQEPEEGSFLLGE